MQKEAMVRCQVTLKESTAKWFKSFAKLKYNGNRELAIREAAENFEKRKAAK